MLKRPHNSEICRMANGSNSAGAATQGDLRLIANGSY